MCNYYAIYLKHPGSAQAYIKFLRKNAMKLGVQFILYPKLHEFPKVFQDAQFGIKFNNFLGVLYYGGDAAFFPKDLEWPGVILDHLYTQQIEAEEYIAKKVLNFVRLQGRNRNVSDGKPVQPVRRFRDDLFERQHGRTLFEDQYYRRLDIFNRESVEIDRLLEDHNERVKNWRREHFDQIRIATLDKKRIDSVMREWVYPSVKRIYDEWLKNNPGKTSVQRNEMYGSIFETEMKKARYHPQFKHPLDLIDELFASKPHKSPELKERINRHRIEGRELEQLNPLAKASGEEWDEMFVDDDD